MVFMAMQTDENKRRLAEIQARYDAAINTPWFDGKYSVNDAKRAPVCRQFTHDDNKRFTAQAIRDIPWLLDVIKELCAQLDAQAGQIAFVDTLLDENIRISNVAGQLAAENEQLKLDIETILKTVEEKIALCDPVARRMLRPVTLEGDAATSFLLAADLSETRRALAKERGRAAAYKKALELGREQVGKLTKG